tara:strand:+ start:1654 stop:2088 length:435 start_codon:yes stop_codon:yes gene_type:complete
MTNETTEHICDGDGDGAECPCRMCSNDLEIEYLQGKVNAMSSALMTIRSARDYHAEHGQYPAGTLQPDQCFDDWAADVAGAGLHQFERRGAKVVLVEGDSSEPILVKPTVRAVIDAISYTEGFYGRIQLVDLPKGIELTMKEEV